MDDIDRFLEEDLGKEGDITSNSLFTDEIAKANILAKEDCIVAGLDEVKMIFEKTGAEPEIKVKNGESVGKGTVVAIINGSIRSILKGERLAINILSRMSGIATETKNLLERCRKINPKVTIAATRKTTPGFRKYEKKAVSIGGGETHRFGLYDAYMIKDNHLKVIGSVEEAIKKVKEKNLDQKIIEIEVENEHEAITAARSGVDVVMLDNFEAVSGKNVARRIKEINPNILIEISGGINNKNIEQYASFADRISIGYLTHSIKSIDFSLKIQ